MNDSHIAYYRKTGLTRMIVLTGDNGPAVREFCRESAAPADAPWGFVTAAEFASKHDAFGGSAFEGYRSDDTPRCTPSNLIASGRGRLPDAAVYDHLHRVWVPLWVGDHVAAGPAGECYPVAAQVHAATYEKVEGAS